MKEVTPSAAFREPRMVGELIELTPTGRVVRMKAVTPAELLRLGKIPDILTDLVIKFLYGDVTEEQYLKFFSPAERKEHALDLIESLKVVCTASLVEPHIVDEPTEDGEIHIDDLEMSEQRFIFDMAMMGVSALRSFLQEQKADVGVVADGQDAESEAV